MDTIDRELKNAWLRQLAEDWRNTNYTNFHDRMKLPIIDLLSSGRMLGTWKGGITGCLSISASLIRHHPWQYVQEVLYHEMTHQYVDEVLGRADEPPHGETFTKVCERNGFDPRASGDMEEWIQHKQNPAVCSQNQKMLDKIRKLLSLARSTNRHEAELAMARAQELLLKHNLSQLELQTDRFYLQKQIGNVGRKNPIKSLIGTILTGFFFVEAIWVFGYDQHGNRGGRVLEIYGTSENVEMAEYVHDYLFTLCERLWEGYKREKGMSGNRYRRTYIYGLLNGFYQKLDHKRAEHKTKSLVWKGDPRLQEFYRKRNPKIRKSGFSYTKSCTDTYNSGVTAGKKIIIHKGMKSNGSGEVRLLR